MRNTLILSVITIGLNACSSQQVVSDTTTTTSPSQKVTTKTKEKAKKMAHDHPMTIQFQENIAKKYDQNSDDAVSWTEFDQWRQKQFKRTDSDKNGTIEAQEYVYEYEDRLDKQMEDARKGSVKQTIVRFDSLDKNDDQKVSWEEYDNSGNRIFSYFDADKNGSINQVDQDIRDTEKLKRNKGKKHTKKRRRSVLNMPTTHNLKGLLKIYDADSDDLVSRNEYDMERKAVFRISDSNKNGWINQEEYLLEFEDRLDTQIKKSRRAAIKQTFVRFDVLDKNKNGNMTFAEYQISGKRSFSRWDRNNDGLVSKADIEIGEESSKAYK